MPPHLERFKLYSVIVDIEDNGRILGFWENDGNARVVYICLNQENFKGEDNLYKQLRARR